MAIMPPLLFLLRVRMVNESKLFIHQEGQGSDLVLLHGWGVNSTVFAPIAKELSRDYKVFNVDLPGFGESEECFGGIEFWTNVIAENIPDDAILIGWSLGGLLAMNLAIHHSNKVNKLVTIASSPCFLANENEQWPGMSPQIFDQFSHQLNLDPDKAVERFLAIQAIGSESMKVDIKQLKHAIETKARLTGLNQGLDILKNVDLRQQISNISQPWLRIWGGRDGLVPRQVIERLPNNAHDAILGKASHAPFISHRLEFIQILLKWNALLTDE